MCAGNTHPWETHIPVTPERRNNPDQHYFCESCHVRYFGSSSYNLAMCINYISGLPSRAPSRAEQLLKINLDVDVDVELLVNNQIILQRIVRQSARVSLGGIQKDIFYENYCSCLTD